MNTLPHRFCKDEQNVIYMIQKYNSENNTIIMKNNIFSDPILRNLDEVQLFTPNPGNSRLFDKYYLGDLYKKNRSSEKKYKILKDEDVVLICTRNNILHFNKTRGIFYASMGRNNFVEINLEISEGCVYYFKYKNKHDLCFHSICETRTKISLDDMKLINMEKYDDFRFIKAPDSYIVKILYEKFFLSHYEKWYKEVIDFLKSKQYLRSVKVKILKFTQVAIQSFIPEISVEWMTNIIKDYL